jgi:hypothetical protein
MMGSADEILDGLGGRLTEAARKFLVRLYPEAETASTAQLEAACAAMQAKSQEVLKGLLAEVKAAPYFAEIAFTTAALSLAEEGIRVLKSGSPEPGEKP